MRLWARCVTGSHRIEIPVTFTTTPINVIQRGREYYTYYAYVIGGVSYHDAHTAHNDAHERYVGMVPRERRELKRSEGFFFWQNQETRDFLQRAYFSHLFPTVCISAQHER